ncbi:MAG: hypothetical protein Tsb005_17660 [Gammaproteobacteria bacterium]
MSNILNNLFFKKVIILFWTVWWLLALWTDVVGGLAHLGWLHRAWAPDTNFPFLLASLGIYDISATTAGLLFVGIILWSAICTLTFVRASLNLSKPYAIWLRYAEMAFIVSLLYWFAFFIADQLVMKYDLEQNHMVQGGFQLLSYLALYVLPNKTDN